MSDFNWILALFRVIGVLVMMSGAVFACWLLSAVKLPSTCRAYLAGRC